MIYHRAWTHFRYELCQQTQLAERCTSHYTSFRTCIDACSLGLFSIRFEIERRIDLIWFDASNSPLPSACAQASEHRFFRFQDTWCRTGSVLFDESVALFLDFLGPFVMIFGGCGTRGRYRLGFSSCQRATIAFRKLRSILELTTWRTAIIVFMYLRTNFERSADTLEFSLKILLFAYRLFPLLYPTGPPQLEPYYSA